MDPTFSRRHRSSSSDRLLRLFSSSPPSSAASTADDDFTEADLFFSGDIPETPSNPPPPPSLPNPRGNSGFLAALSGPNLPSVLRRKPAVPPTPSKMVPFPEDRELFSQSLPSRKFQQSAPMKVPIMPSRTMPRRKFDELAIVDDDIDDDDEMLPPHEIVARASGVSHKTTSSVLEGIGRTLKGRDLRQVRNAVWRQTGFLD